jgi:hypothetical protein
VLALIAIAERASAKDELLRELLACHDPNWSVWKKKINAVLKGE